IHRRETPRPATPPPAPVPAAGPTRVFHVVPNPQNASYSLDGGPLVQIQGGFADIEVPPGAHKLVLRNDKCCEDWVQRIEPTDPGKERPARLLFKPTSLKALCPQAKVITVNGNVVDSGVAVDIRDFSQGSKESVDVDFYVGDNHHDHQKVTVQ